jgi:hypothetical protein
LLVALAGCGWPEVVGSGHVITDERQTSSFSALEVSDGIDATVVVDATQPMEVRVVGDDNLVERVRTLSSEDGTLRVDFRDEHLGGWNSPNPLRVEVTVPQLESLSRSGGGTVDLRGDITSPSFQLSASGGGTVKVQGLASQELSVELSGGVLAILSGQANRATSAISGGSELSARGLSVQEASLDSSGGGSTVLQVSDSLRVSASGGAEVRIIGRPSVLSKNLSGGASLTFE